MTARIDKPPSQGTTGSTAAERFLAVAELRHRLCTVADKTTVTWLARTNRQLLHDAVRVFYRSIDFNSWLRLYPATGLAQASALDGPRKRLYGEAVKALRITNMIPDGVGFAHGVELHMREQGSTSDVKVALLGTRTPNGHVPQRDFAMSIPILVQHLRPHFPRVCEIRISPTRYASDWFDQCDPWETRPDECVVQLDVDPNFGIPDTPTGTIRQIRYGQKGLFEYAIRPKDHDGFTPDFRVHAICPVSDAKKRWISVNAHQGNMNVDVNPSVTTVLDLCLKHCSIPRDFETIDLICDSPQWVLSDIRILLEGLASRAGGGSVRHFRAATPVTFDRDALRAMLTSTCIADLGMTELDLAADDQPGELALHTHMTAGSLVELVQALPACLSTLSVACIALEQVPSWPESPPGIPPKLSTMHVRFFGIVLQADVINTAYLIARYTEPGCGIWTTSAGGGIPVRHDSEVDYLTDDDDDQNPEAEPYDDDEHEGEDEDEDASDDEPGEEDGEDDQKDVQKAGEALGESDWTYSMAMLRRAIEYNPSVLDGLDLRKLGMVSPESVVEFCERPDKEKRAKIDELRRRQDAI